MGWNESYSVKKKYSHETMFLNTVMESKMNNLTHLLYVLFNRRLKFKKINLPTNLTSLI